jgi:hypothetical protein
MLLCPGVVLDEYQNSASEIANTRPAAICLSQTLKIFQMSSPPTARLLNPYETLPVMFYLRLPSLLCRQCRRHLQSQLNIPLSSSHPPTRIWSLRFCHLLKEPLWQNPRKCLLTLSPRMPFTVVLKPGKIAFNISSHPHP